MKLGGKVHFGVLSSKMEVIRSKWGASASIRRTIHRFRAYSSIVRFKVYIQTKRGSVPPVRCT